MFGRNEPEPRVTLRGDIENLIDMGYDKHMLSSLLHAANRERVIVYIEDKSILDSTPVFVIGAYRTLSLISAIQHLEGA